MRWRQMCLFSIEDHRDLEDFDRLDGLTEVDTALVSARLVRGHLERGLAWRGIYHELKALQALRRAGMAGYSRAREAALREFLGFTRDADDGFAESDMRERSNAITPSGDDDKPPGRHPPEASGRPRVVRVRRFRARRTRRGGHGGSPRAFVCGSVAAPTSV
jgi:hypothetical protein